MDGVRSRIMQIQSMLNASIVDDDRKLSLERLFSTASIVNMESFLGKLDRGDDLSEDEMERISEAFGVNKDWLVSGDKGKPFLSARMGRFTPYDAMDILRWEYLSEIKEFIVAFAMLGDMLHAIIIRHSGEYCYEVYRHIYPFYSSVGASGKHEILEFYRFLQYASRIGILNKRAFFCEEYRFLQYYKGEIAPIGIVNEKGTGNLIDELLGLSETRFFQEEPGDSFRDLENVISIIRAELDFYEDQNDENDWNAIIRKNPQLAESDEKRFKAYVKEVELVDDRLTGIEADDIDDAFDDEEEPYDVNNIVIISKTIAAFMVERWIQSDMLDLSPEYQRNLVWDKFRKSSLIESMMLNIPIPAFYLDEKEDGVKTVIDGMQRLSTIHSFFSGQFELRGLQYMKMYNGFRFHDLSAKYRTRLEDTQLVMNILDARCPQDAKFDVFCRVNTGGMPLNAQEVRNALSTRNTRRLLKDMSRNSAFMDATLSRISDVRMGAQELCLRYLCILDHFDWESMTMVNFKGLKKTMDGMVMSLNSDTEDDNRQRLELFQHIMEQCSIALGSISFSRQPEPFKINKSIFTAWAICLHHLHIENEALKARSALLRETYTHMLLEDKVFLDAVSKSTTHRRSIEYTIKVIRELIEECVYDS